MAYDLEWFLNRFSMITLIVTGVFLIYEGATYLALKKRYPNLPTKVTVAAYLSIILGVMEIVGGVLHYWF